MPATIISSPQFAAGAVVLLRHTLSVEENGFVSVPMSMACLGTEAVMARTLALFKPNALPPVALPDNVKATPLVNKAVYLADYQSRTENGICYIDANYVGISALDLVQRSQSQEVKSFGGLFNYRLDLGGNTAIVNITGNISFDYVATSLAAVWCSYSATEKNILTSTPEGERFNIRRDSTVNALAGSIRDPQKFDVLKKQITQVGPVYIISESLQPEMRDAE
jgi:hypothetical protein